ncbi:MAG: histidinol phosphate phosphatase [Armatimonadetes bacterium]|nr:histidinol phosphate phosphatase [Armatimonadota bacterium]
MTDRLAFAIETAEEAANSTLRHFQGGGGFELKGDDSPVTTADREAESIVRRRIHERFPGEAVLGEEEGGDASKATRWVVDPIDGTKSFIAGVPLYGTLLAFEEDNTPVLGVACFPALGDVVYAEVGSGAFWNGHRCQVRRNAELKRAIICCCSTVTLAKQGRLEGLLELAEATMATRTWCDAYGHSLVATGRADAMIDAYVSRWDISAMSVIVREAGGRFTDFQGGGALSDEAISCTSDLQSQILGAFA